MKYVSGLFKDADEASSAIAELRSEDYVQDISVIALDEDARKVLETRDEQADETINGIVTGGAAGAIIGALAGVATALVPGLGPVVVAGPLVASWGLTGGALGALGGGLVGALQDAGLSEEEAKIYEKRLREGEVIVITQVEDNNTDEAKSILAENNVTSISVSPTT